MKKIVELPTGFIVHINGIPFSLEQNTKISGNSRNFVVANIINDYSKDCFEQQK